MTATFSSARANYGKIVVHRPKINYYVNKQMGVN
nr:MAG TPA: hypothetical protein [Bacteriophage sp.]